MKTNLGPTSELFPQSVFIVATYSKEGVPNAMNVAWGGACAPGEICVNLGKHQTTDNIMVRGAFTVAPADASNVMAADYFGIVSGRNENKEEKTGLTFLKAENVDAPYIDEFPLTMECEVIVVQDYEGEKRVVGKVVNTIVDEAVLDKSGQVDFEKMMPIVYDSSQKVYRVVREVVGDAWGTGKALL